MCAASGGRSPALQASINRLCECTNIARRGQLRLLLAQDLQWLFAQNAMARDPSAGNR